MATLKDIARRLNLSVMAVSKALRDAPDISVATKERVKAEAQLLHYVPNRAAQNLRNQVSQLIGVVIPNINHTLYANLVWGVERQAEALGLQVVLGHSIDRADQELKEIRKLIALQVRGVIIIPAVRWQNRLAGLELLRDANVPAVMLERYPAGAEQFPQASWVVSENLVGTQLATQHLLDLGHRKILFFAGPNGSSAAAERFAGYQRAMQNSEAGFHDDLVFLAGSDIDAGRQTMAKALSEEIHFTAIVSHNDSVALGTIYTLEQQGFRVPQDVSVTGFGDGPLAANFRVSLTTLRIPHTDMGSAAVHQLINLCEGKKVQPRQLPVELIIRTSTALRTATKTKVLRTNEKTTLEPVEDALPPAK
jgi:LacI family transcriptional regulator